MKKYIKIWLTQNAHAFFFSLGQYIKNPINNILTTVVIGISLAFPAGFYVFLNNIQILSKDWDNVIEIFSPSGISLKNTQIHDRMNKCIQIMEEKYIDDSFCNVCPIIIKKYFDLGELETVMNEFIPNLPYRVRGFYFIPLKTNYSKILYLMKEGDYKKANSKNKKYISFRIIKTVKPDVYELYLYNEQKTTIHKHSYATIPNIQTSEWVKKLVDDKDECYVECSYNPIFKKWAPMKESFGADTIIDVK